MTVLQARMTKVVLSGVLSLSAVLFLVPCGFANEIHVNNDSFETTPFHNNTLPSCGPLCEVSDASNGIPGWTIANPGPLGETGLFRPGVLQGNHEFFNTLPGEGPTIAYTVGGVIEQRDVTKVVPRDVYTLTLEIGHEKVPPPPQGQFAAIGTADLEVGHTVVATATYVRDEPIVGGWAEYIARFIGNAADAGEPITIQLKAPPVSAHNPLGHEGDFDSVMLTAHPVPEPGTLLLFGSGLLLIGIVVHRHQVHAKAKNIGLIDVA